MADLNFALHLIVCLFVCLQTHIVKRKTKLLIYGCCEFSSVGKQCIMIIMAKPIYFLLTKLLHIKKIV